MTPRYPSVAHLVAQQALATPNRTAIRFDNSEAGFGTLDARANAVCNALARLGVAHGEMIGVMLENGPESVDIWIGIARYGAVEVPVSAALRGDGLAYPFARCACRIILASAALAERIEAIRPQLPTLEHLLIVDDPASWPELLAEAGSAPYTSPVTADDIGVVLFSSGTTGPPKGVVLPHSAGAALAEGVAAVMRYGPDDILYNAFPLSHVNARYTTVYPALLVGGRAVLHRRFSASGFWKTCRDEGVTAFNYMGVMPVLLLNQPDEGHDRDHGVTRAYGAGAADQVADRFTARFGIPLVETYGSTELGMVTCAKLEERRPGSCGVASPDYEIEIQDDRGVPAEPGVAGEIVVRPRRPGVMFREYLGDPAATVEATRGLWFHTGDRGKRDEDGWLYFVDRLKDVIRRRGENISSWEVERVLEAHPAIAEASAVGIGSDISGQEVMAAIVLAGEPLPPEDLLRHCEQHLPHYAIPRYVRIMPSLPRTASARVEKYRIRAEGVTAETWDREAEGYRLTR